jgi:hypothetical protein
MTHTHRHITVPYSRPYTNFVPDSSTNPAVLFIKTELVTQNAHNVCAPKPSNKISSPTAGYNLQVTLGYISIKNKLTYKNKT